jgi:hypothetical protein
MSHALGALLLMHSLFQFTHFALCQMQFAIASLAEAPYPHLSVFLSRAKYQFSDLRCTKWVVVSFRSFPFRSVVKFILDEAIAGRVPSHAGLLMVSASPQFLECTIRPMPNQARLEVSKAEPYTSLPHDGAGSSQRR